MGWATLSALPPPAQSPSLTLPEVSATLGRVAAISGDGSAAERGRALDDLFRAATEAEQQFLYALLTGNVRQGASVGVVVDAIAKGSEVSAASARRAHMLSGDLAQTAVDAFTAGQTALDEYQLQPLRAVLPMLAKSSESATAAVGELADTVVDWKMDGIRVQVHRLGDDVRVFTRSLRRIQAPALVAACRTLAVADVILDGEALGVDEAGAPLAFPETVGSLAERDRPEGLTVRFFDVLYARGESLIDQPLRRRLAVLDEIVPAELRMPRLETKDGSAAEAFFEDAVGRGYEGVVVKAADSTYEAGRRGAAWRKVKPVHTLDLVVLAVEWGSGRRAGTLSNIHLGARDGDDFVMLGKTFKGMTDEMLRWQTERFLELEVRRERHVVHVRPEQIVEVAFDGVLPSPRYPGGVSLRFARVRRYRDDKSASEADTLATVRSYLSQKAGRLRN